MSTLQSFIEKSAPHSDSNALQSLRDAAFDRLTLIGWPTPKDEPWKYVPVGPLLKKEVCLPTDAKGNDLASDTHAQFCNGQLSIGTASLGTGASQIQLSRLSDVLDHNAEALHFFKSKIEAETNPFALLGFIHQPDGLWIDGGVSDGLSAPVVVDIKSDGSDDNVLTLPLIGVSVAAARQIHVMIRVSASGGNLIVNCASLYGTVQSEGRFEVVVVSEVPDTVNRFNTVRLDLHQKSTLNGVMMVKDGGLQKEDIQVNFLGSDINAQFSGLSILDGNSQWYAQTTFNHIKGAGFSEQLFKNILTDRAKTEFNGLVSVAPKAHETDSSQHNHNLLLSDDARAYSRPQLNILADDVACAHGATIGQLDEGQLFYLMSRGMRRKAAQSLLLYGFGEEVVEHVSTPQFHAELEPRLKQRLQRLADDMA